MVVGCKTGVVPDEVCRLVMPVFSRRVDVLRKSGAPGGRSRAVVVGCRCL